MSDQGIRGEDDLADALKGISLISQDEQEEATRLSDPFVETEVRDIRGKLPNKKSSLPTGVAYESLKTFLEHEGGVEWIAMSA